MPGPAVPRSTPGRAAFAVAGVLLVAYPVLRPWADADPAAAGAAFEAPSWIPAHVAAVLGFVLVALGLLGLRDLLAAGPGARPAHLALLAFWVGSGMVGPYYGAEAFALHAVGERALRGADPAAAALVDAIRNGPVQLTLFGAGLVLMAAGAVLAAVALGRGGVQPRWAGVPFAVAFVLYLPQFFGPPWLRVGHGVLTAAACLLMAASLGRRSAGRTSDVARAPVP